MSAPFAQPGRPHRRGGAAGWLLLLAWTLAVTASNLGRLADAFAFNVVAAFLLWLTWRGAAWSRHLLVVLACISAGLAVGIMVAIAWGAPGINFRALGMFVLYAGVGGVLCTPQVRALARASRDETGYQTERK